MTNLLLFLSAFMLLSMAGYPLVAWLRYCFARRPVQRDENFVQPVSIIIACYNEEKHIARKLHSFLHRDEWIAGSEIIVVSTGSTDGTNAIMDSFSRPELKIVKHPQHVSKITGVNMAAALATNELLVFSDCRQTMKPGSVKKLVRNFNDPEVGTVAGVLENNGSAGRPSFFRRLLNQCAWWDSETGSALNVYGALYAQRKSVFRPFPQSILFDDLYVVVSTIVQGKRLVQDRQAVLYDIDFGTYYHGNRIKRLVRGLLLFLVEERSLIRSMPLPDLLRFLLFKYAKLLMPYFILLWLVYGIAWLLPMHNYLLPAILIAGSVLLLLRRPRKLLLLFARINYYFMVATFRFVFFKDRSVMWGKLNVKQLSQVPE